MLAEQERPVGEGGGVGVESQDELLLELGRARLIAGQGGGVVGDPDRVERLRRPFRDRVGRLAELVP